MSRYYGGEDLPFAFLLAVAGGRMLYVGFDVWGYVIGAVLLLIGMSIPIARVSAWRAVKK